MRTILITGAAGYIGSVLTPKLLKSGYNIIAVDSLLYNQTSLLGCINCPSFTFHKLDVRDRLIEPLYQQADIIIPLAGIVGAPACKLNPNSRSINQDAITHLAGFKDKLILYPNTNSGYGTKTNVKFCTEETPLEPISKYGQQKVETEQFLLSYHPKTISLRLATVFGASPRMRWDLLVNGLVYDAMRFKSIVLYEPHNKRNYVHIKDVVECFLFCINNWETMTGQAYNLGLESANLSKLELADVVRYYSQCEVFASARKIDPDKRNYIVSNKKLKKAGFSAVYSIDDGVQELITAYDMIPKNEVWRNV